MFVFSSVAMTHLRQNVVKRNGTSHSSMKRNLTDISLNTTHLSGALVLLSLHANNSISRHTPPPTPPHPTPATPTYVITVLADHDVSILNVLLP